MYIYTTDLIVSERYIDLGAARLQTRGFQIGTVPEGMYDSTDYAAIEARLLLCGVRTSYDDARMEVPIPTGTRAITVPSKLSAEENDAHKRNYLSGIFILLFVVVLWTSSSFITQVLTVTVFLHISAD
jgi:hypothetical protein